MSDITITLADRAPSAPKADFAFYIDFKKGEGSPSRVFTATSEFIKACEKLDKALVQSVDSNIEAVMVLEDIEAASLKTWLRNLLSATDDEALKTLDWKPQVGKYLVRAKYAILHWIDHETDAPKSLPALAKEIQKIAAETDVRHLPDYAPPSPRTLLDALSDFQAVKDRLHESDRAAYISDEGELEINLKVRWNLEDIEALAIKEVIAMPPAPVILAVKKPDYLGDSKWDMRHGRRTIPAKISDAAWLRRFQGRQVDVRPGDALKCLVAIEHVYGHDNELISERYTVLEVYEVLPSTYTEQQLFSDEDIDAPAKKDDDT